MTRVAVIGHGRSPEGKGWGAKIDSCQTVIRMWDNHWQDERDYGVKYDYGYYEISPRQLERYIEYNRKVPKLGWLAGMLKSKTDHTPPENTLVISPWTWVNVGYYELGGRGAGEKGKLTLPRGMVAACWAVDSVPGDIILVGFDNTHAGKLLPIEEGFSDVYREQPSTGPFKDYHAGETKYHNHDHAVERPLIELLAKRAGKKVFFAQEIW